MTDKSVRKLGLLPMTALVTGAIVGSGIFSLPQNMAEGAGGLGGYYYCLGYHFLRYGYFGKNFPVAVD